MVRDARIAPFASTMPARMWVPPISIPRTTKRIPPKSDASERPAQPATFDDPTNNELFTWAIAPFTAHLRNWTFHAIQAAAVAAPRLRAAGLLAGQQPSCQRDAELQHRVAFVHGGQGEGGVDEHGRREAGAAGERASGIGGHRL